MVDLELVAHKVVAPRAAEAGVLNGRPLDTGACMNVWRWRAHPGEEVEGRKKGPKTRNRAEEDEEGRGRRACVLKRLDSLMVEEAAGCSQRGGGVCRGPGGSAGGYGQHRHRGRGGRGVCGVRDEL